MDIRQFFPTKIIPDFETNLVSTLKSVYDGTASHELLTKRTAEITLQLMGKLQEKEQVSFVSYAMTAARQERITELLPTENEWDNEELYNLLRFLFGDEKAVYVKHAWSKFPNLMYMSGWNRRSFRAPERREKYLPNQLTFLKGIMLQVHVYGIDTHYQYECYDLTIKEQIIVDHEHDTQYLYHMWAAAIDLGNEEIFKLFEDIIYNKEPEGKVSDGIIRALLLSEREDAWQLVEKLLLSAQRQEGLRQTILEALDDCSTGALKYMLKVVIDNKLTRFSSVVRALDVWAGINWESEKESAVIRFLQKAHTYLSDPSLIPAAINGDDFSDIYMGLWAQGVYNVEQTLPYLTTLAHSSSRQKRSIAQQFVDDTSHYQLMLSVGRIGIEDESLAVVALATAVLREPIADDPKRYNEQYPDLFDKLHAVILRSDVKEKTFDKLPFSWMNNQYKRSDVLQAMLPLIFDQQDRLDLMMSYFDDMDLDVKSTMTRRILKGYAKSYYEDPEKLEPVTSFQRGFSMRIIRERGESLQNAGFKALATVELDKEELKVFKDLLKRKSGGIRNQIIGILLKQPDTLLISVLKELLEGDGEQRLAGLDIALQLQQQQRLLDALQPLLEAFRSRKSIPEKEAIILGQLSAEGTGAVVYDSSNGYGLYDPAAIPPIVKPVPDPTDFYHQCLAQGNFGLSQPVEKVKQALLDLYKLFIANKDFEYQVEGYNNNVETVLLGQLFSRMSRIAETTLSPEEEYATYPLPELWKGWYEQSGLTPGDLYILSELTVQSEYDGFTEDNQVAKPFIAELMAYMPENLPSEYAYRWSNPLLQIMQALQIIHPFAETEPFLVGAAATAFAALPEEVLKATFDTYSYYNGGDGWQQDSILNWYINKITISRLPEELLTRCWDLYHWRQFSGLPQNSKYYLPPLDLFGRAFQSGLISESEMYRGILSGDNIRELSDRKRAKHEKSYFDRYPFLQAMFLRVREHLLDIELKRGDTATTVTDFVKELESLEGINRFADILAGMGKTTLHKGYIYSSESENKQQLFSTLLKRCFPLDTDTDEMFAAAMKRIKVTETRLLEAAVYAPQWQKFVSKYLSWKGLDTAIWWMHAHTKTSTYAEKTPEAESEIARYSTIDVQDFKDGAVDKEWFEQAYQEIGQERWQKVYDAAKYISDGNGHRRARLYADVMTGDLKIKEVTEKVKDKRDQDYLRVYGLIPLNKSNAEKDILARYEYIQQFKKESKQFGAQKQTSEGTAIRIAMENLARNAGYADPQRLTWAMETKQVQQILSRETQVQYDDVLIGLIIGDDGEADVVAFKEDKKLAGIPAKYKKDTKVLELLEFKKTLREQFRRSRKALEEAMVRGDAFEAEELSNLFTHPIIARHLDKLVFVTSKGHGFWKDGALAPAKGKATKIAAGDKVRIAHCVDLHANGSWSDYQQYCFEKQVQQPFKQIFRELYVPIHEELQEKSISRRYAGHQVQPSKTVALLKSRGWKVDYEEGLQKVFHKQGFMVKMYAQANWFSPAEVESPVLEEIIFHNIKTWENVAFETIDPLIFSEVMRDIDLVVSVAHAGGVDPEASHSTIEMRTVLLQESARLFKLDNVTVSGNHAKIAGEYGEYSVHLGSAVVHQMPGKYLSILPVHSQQRGRLFLPFADDDPKSAELIAKVLLLARDKEIQDPTILRQLRFTN
ncbi:DUF4132 domain-containing protein [Chitinophaga pinensis]|uniref:DUF4132 domain-containing protein n=1 Tax=Chitinophaga pinensis (strain ATCC 43595 / DSM 2588 / LMG 13176 / NBRC 15968 / NCIMB 11800 / UQM 2034) TaxID=485918 RepID=A0A979G6I5_CHIPD|nr:DUF4132 domain-containing protein [Chitinophaga pinensis]ACU61588.1 hypothetical protein Cpin_4129 [Chitinophaga pinensis DSM 2588]